MNFDDNYYRILEDTKDSINELKELSMYPFMENEEQYLDDFKWAHGGFIEDLEKMETGKLDWILFKKFSLTINHLHCSLYKINDRYMHDVFNKGINDLYDVSKPLIEYVVDRP